MPLDSASCFLDNRDRDIGYDSHIFKEFFYENPVVDFGPTSLLKAVQNSLRGKQETPRLDHTLDTLRVPKARFLFESFIFILNLKGHVVNPVVDFGPNFRL